MIETTAPIAITPEEVWVFTTSKECTAARIAISDDHDAFLALPVTDFDVNGIFPTNSDGDLIPNTRWATAADIDEYASLFETQ